jgi:phospholipase C
VRFALVALLAACGDNTKPSDCHDTPDACRAACAYGAGDLASTTVADLAPPAIPIDHFILIMQENRTFDSYFSKLTIPGQTIEVAGDTTGNVDAMGNPANRFHQTTYCFDNPAESWDEVHREVDGGKMDGFAVQNATATDPTGSRAFGYYDETDLPYYYALSRAFAISDSHFASVQANTFTNRAFYMAGTAFGITTNSFTPDMDANGNPLPDLFSRLDDAKVDWAMYAQDAPSIGILVASFGKNLKHVNPYDQFFTDAAAGTLPPVVFVEGSDQKGGVSPDEDPPADMQVGEKFVHDIVAAVTASPVWPHAAVMFSFDEQGGLYDHVPPPKACIPDDIPPMLSPDNVQAAYDAYGLRVPLIVVSPYAKRGYVSHVVTDHTSTLRLLEARFKLPALTHRDANAVPPFDMFDFDHPDPSVPPLPDAPVDDTQRTACAAKYPAST